MSDQNRSSNRRIPNTVVDAIDESGFLTELERIGAKAGRQTILKTELERRIREEGILLNRLKEAGAQDPLLRSTPFYSEHVSHLRESIRNLRRRMNSLEETSIVRAENEAANYIYRQYAQSSINARSHEIMQQSAVQGRALSMLGRPYQELEAQREAIMAEIRRNERLSVNEVRGLFGRQGQVVPEKSATLGAMMYSTQEKIQELATINLAQQMQRRAGEDPVSRMRYLADISKKANKILTSEDIAREIREGAVTIQEGGAVKTVANKDINKELVEQARKLTSALKELSSITDQTSEEFNNFKKQAEESAKNLEKLQEARSMGGGGGGGVNRIALANAFSSGFYAISNAVQDIAINQRFGQLSNVTGFANLANEQYDLYRRARAGDIRSQLMLSQYRQSEEFANEIKDATYTVQGLQAGAALAQTAAGAFQAVEGLAQKNPLSMAGSGLAGTASLSTQAIINGVFTFFQGISNLAITGSDIAKSVTAGQNKLAAVQAQSRAREAVMYVGAEQLQGLRNYYGAVNTAAMGAGANAGVFIYDATSREMLEKMVNARISPEQFAQMSQFGFENIGSVFKLDQVMQARALERSGFGSTLQNMQRMAILSEAGVNNPRESLEKVIAAGMAKGLDTSKAISMMVENTAAMAATTTGAAMGVNTTPYVASMLASTINPNIENKEFALQQARTAAEITRSITTNANASYMGMLNISSMQSRLASKGIKISDLEASILQQKFDVQTLRSIQSLSGEEIDKLLLKQGISLRDPNQAKLLVTTALKEKQEQLLRAGGLALNVDVARLMKEIQSGEPLSREAIAQLGQIANLQGRLGGSDELISQFRGIFRNTFDTSKLSDILSGKEEKSLKKQFDTLVTSSDAQKAESALFATNKLKDFGGPLEVFSQLIKNLESQALQTEKMFSEAASKMANSFDVSVEKFDKATTKYQEASQAIINAVDILSSGRKIEYNQDMYVDKLNTTKQSKSR